MHRLSQGTLGLRRQQEGWKLDCFVLFRLKLMLEDSFLTQHFSHNFASTNEEGRPHFHPRRLAKDLFAVILYELSSD